MNIEKWLNQLCEIALDLKPVAIFDGELIRDHVKGTNNEDPIPNYLAFDCLYAEI